MKEIMVTSRVEGYISFWEVLDMVERNQHPPRKFFLAQCLVGQCADTAVALQCALAYLEQHAHILIVEKADTFRDSRLFPLSLHRQQLVRPSGRAGSISFCIQASRVVSCEQFRDLVLPSFWFCRQCAACGCVSIPAVSPRAR